MKKLLLTELENSPNTFSRILVQNILRKNHGLTSYSNRHVCPNKPLSAWKLIINKNILRIIMECTEAEAKRKL